MSTPTPSADHTDPVDRGGDSASDDGALVPGAVVDAPEPAEPIDAATGPEAEPDVRSGGHAGQAPRSLTQAEARWQDHESSGSSWDSRESI